jgi:hypothetical protein
LGAKAVGVGRYYLFPLAAAGQAGVEQALSLMRTEIERDMKLMGCSSVSQLTICGSGSRRHPRGAYRSAANLAAQLTRGVMSAI